MTGHAARVPATILTGFLGSGKSTLLKHILTGDHGQRIAVVENEFGEENIDGEIIASGAGEQIVQLSNGCICCSIRDDLRVALAGLMARRLAGEIGFDRAVIETTGLADPGPVAQTFFLDEDVARHYRPDAIIAMVDAKFAMRQLDDRQEARRQVGFADRIFISKTDLASREDLAALELRLSHINPRAPRKAVLFGEIALAEVFDVGGFNLNADLDLATAPDPLDACADPAHDHAPGEPHHYHHDDVQSFVFRAERSLHPGRFGQFLNAVVKSHGQRLLRYKGVLSLQGVERKVIFQGVHQLTSNDLGEPWAAGETRSSRLVFIGMDLPKPLFLRSLEQCLV